MCSDFLYQLRSHRHHFVKFVLCLYLFLCVKHVWDNWRGRRLWNRSVIRILNTRNVLPSEIHHQICQLYGDNAMSVGMVRKWVRMFNVWRENMHDEARSGRPSLVNDDLVLSSTKECVTTDVSQFLICPCTFLRFQGLLSMTLSVVIWVIGDRILWGGYTKTCAPLL